MFWKCSLNFLKSTNCFVCEKKMPIAIVLPFVMAPVIEWLEEVLSVILWDACCIILRLLMHCVMHWDGECYMWRFLSIARETLDALLATCTLYAFLTNLRLLWRPYALCNISMLHLNFIVLVKLLIRSPCEPSHYNSNDNLLHLMNQWWNHQFNWLICQIIV